MKAILLLASHLIITYTLHAQDCSRNFLPTIGISYLTSQNNAASAALEVGIIGDRLPLVGLINFTGYPKRYQFDERGKLQQVEGPGFGLNIGGTGGLRLYRKDYKLSIYALSSFYIGDFGSSGSASLRLLFPVKQSAISVEPFYLFIEKDFGIKFTANFQCKRF